MFSSPTKLQDKENKIEFLEEKKGGFEIVGNIHEQGYDIVLNNISITFIELINDNKFPLVIKKATDILEGKHEIPSLSSHLSELRLLCYKYRAWAYLFRNELSKVEKDLDECQRIEATSKDQMIFDYEINTLSVTYKITMLLSEKLASSTYDASSKEQIKKLMQIKHTEHATHFRDVYTHTRLTKFTCKDEIPIELLNLRCAIGNDFLSLLKDILLIKQHTTASMTKDVIDFMVISIEKLQRVFIRSKQNLAAMYCHNLELGAQDATEKAVNEYQELIQFNQDYKIQNTTLGFEFSIIDIYMKSYKITKNSSYKIMAEKYLESLRKHKLFITNITQKYIQLIELRHAKYISVNKLSDLDFIFSVLDLMKSKKLTLSFDDLLSKTSYIENLDVALTRVFEEILTICDLDKFKNDKVFQKTLLGKMLYYYELLSRILFEKYPDKSDVPLGCYSKVLQKRCEILLQEGLVSEAMAELEKLKKLESEAHPGFKKEYEILANRVKQAQELKAIDVPILSSLKTQILKNYLNFTQQEIIYILNIVCNKGYVSDPKQDLIKSLRYSLAILLIKHDLPALQKHAQLIIKKILSVRGRSDELSLLLADAYSYQAGIGLVEKNLNPKEAKAISDKAMQIINNNMQITYLNELLKSYVEMEEMVSQQQQKMKSNKKASLKLSTELKPNQQALLVDIEFYLLKLEFSILEEVSSENYLNGPINVNSLILDLDALYRAMLLIKPKVELFLKNTNSTALSFKRIEKIGIQLDINIAKLLHKGNLINIDIMVDKVGKGYIPSEKEYQSLIANILEVIQKLSKYKCNYEVYIVYINAIILTLNFVSITNDSRYKNYFHTFLERAENQINSSYLITLLKFFYKLLILKKEKNAQIPSDLFAEGYSAFTGFMDPRCFVKKESSFLNFNFEHILTDLIIKSYDMFIIFLYQSYGSKTEEAFARDSHYIKLSLAQLKEKLGLEHPQLTLLGENFTSIIKSISKIQSLSISLAAEEKEKSKTFVEDKLSQQNLLINARVEKDNTAKKKGYELVGLAAKALEAGNNDSAMSLCQQAFEAWEEVSQSGFNDNKLREEKINAAFILADAHFKNGSHLTIVKNALNRGMRIANAYSELFNSYILKGKEKFSEYTAAKKAKLPEFKTEEPKAQISEEAPVEEKAVICSAPLLEASEKSMVIDNPELQTHFFKIIPENTLNEILALSDDFSRPPFHTRVHVVGSAVLKWLLYIFKHDQLAESMRLKDIDLSIVPVFPRDFLYELNNEGDEGRTLDQIIKDKTINNIHPTKADTTYNSFYGNYSYKQPESKAKIDVALAFPGFTETNKITPTMQRMYFSSQPSLETGDISVAITLKDRSSPIYVVLQNRNDGFFAECKEGILVLHQLPKMPKLTDKVKPTGSLDRMKRLGKKLKGKKSIPGFKLNPLAKIALTNPAWEMNFYASRIFEQPVYAAEKIGGIKTTLEGQEKFDAVFDKESHDLRVDECIKEVVQMIKHQGFIPEVMQSCELFVQARLLSKYCLVSSLESISFTSAFTYSNELSRAEEDAARGKKLLQLAEKTKPSYGPVIAKGANSISTAIINYLKKSYENLEEANTISILGDFKKVLNYLIQTYSYFKDDFSATDMDNLVGFLQVHFKEKISVSAALSSAPREVSAQSSHITTLTQPNGLGVFAQPQKHSTSLSRPALKSFAPTGIKQ